MFPPLDVVGAPLFPEPWQGLLHLTSDLLIGTAYVSISATLLYWARRARRYLAFDWVFLAFAAFILGCGATHFGHVLLQIAGQTRWTLAVLAATQLVTVVASVATAALIIPVVPKALAILASASVSEERRRALAARDEFLSVAAHELKTPLTAVLAASELAERRLNQPERLAPLLAGIRRGTLRLSALVTQLLDLSRIEAGQLALQYEETDLAQLAGEVVARVQSTTHYPLRLVAPASLPARADPLRLEQILSNLLGNALKFAPDERGVEITLASPDADTAIVRVRDYGPGIPPELRDQLFDRYAQADASSSTAGLGLGLYISRRIAELHGGQLTLEDGDGPGACFVVTIPRGVPEERSTWAAATPDRSSSLTTTPT